MIDESASAVADIASKTDNELYGVDAIIYDVDYFTESSNLFVRLSARGSDGKFYEILDDSFKPYFYFVPNSDFNIEMLKDENFIKRSGIEKIIGYEKEKKLLLGKDVDAYKIILDVPMQVPKLSSYLSNYGSCYEYDIPFAKRYVIDKEIPQFIPTKIKYKKINNKFMLDDIEKLNLDDQKINGIQLNTLCFDIEVYNPFAAPRVNIDPIIMISYLYVVNGKKGSGVITTKKINKPFVEYVENEKLMIKRFMDLINELDIDIITGYNSTNFDIKYLLDRAAHLKIDFDISRFHDGTKLERHGLVERVKASGRVHIDAYLVVKFIATVGAAEYILKLNSYTLKNVYEAISKNKKVTVEKKDIYKIWDGSEKDLENLAEYNMNDSEALFEVYNTFMPIMIELTRITNDLISDVAVSTTGQLVEFLLINYSHKTNSIVPNKPDEREIEARMMNPIEGAYVKTPNPGIYDSLVVFDFRGLYPSIIISHNIDPSMICNDCKEYHESPIGVKFRKDMKGIIPTILEILVNQRMAVKKAYKKDPTNIALGSRSQALKILANSFFGYLGYARSRWYSRDCAASITAYGRYYIHQTIEFAEQQGFKVLYSDTDSVILIMGNKTKDEALAFMKELNAKLPSSMELELEDFYKRGVFVGKKVNKEEKGAKKKYALLSESGRIKIRGFELVRRDWSKIARETQQKVLESILKEGSKEKAIEIVKDIINKVRSNEMPLSEFIINTKLRKGINSYDAKSPELIAAKKAIDSGFRTKEEIEGVVISYIITKHGSSTSEKAEIEGIAKDYDPEYYIHKQIIPATMRILKELGIEESELSNEGKQKKL
ncbi:MAG: DNA-directed DNA polymerase [Candidatus Micrarchaeia archaeon]